MLKEMEIREGGNVILQFILEEHLLPYPSDSYQLPQERAKWGRETAGREGQIEEGLEV